MAIVDDLKSIPGYPKDCNPDRDGLRFVITNSTPTIPIASYGSKP